MKYGAISIDASTLKGTPVFSGTDVPVQAFFEYLEDGRSMEKFLKDNPSVNKKDAVEVLQMAKSLITSEEILRNNFSGDE
jgi:uncharacterized protein (DUF433 family)